MIWGEKIIQTYISKYFLEATAWDTSPLSLQHFDLLVNQDSAPGHVFSRYRKKKY
jgi:hypothetical protein